MMVIGRGCEGVILMAFVFVLSSVLTTCEGVRWSQCVNQSQVEAVLKRFKTSGESFEERLRKILNCVRGGCYGGYDPLPKEILLRGQMRERGQECTSAGNYSKPFYESVAYNGPEKKYRKFQEELLDTGLTFCNPFKHLYCSPQNKCECRPGTVLKPEVNPDVCTLIPGAYCVEPGLRDDSEFQNSLYDPFNHEDIYRGLMEIPRLHCPQEDGLTCIFGLDYFHRYICGNDTIREFDKKLVVHFKDLPRLSFGDPCNFEHNQEVLKSPEAEWLDYRIRLKKLEKIVGARTQLCDLRRLLVCGNSGKCECIQPTLYDENTKNCTYTHPSVLCSQIYTNIKLADSLTGNASRELREGYASAEVRECKGGCKLISLGGDRDNLLVCHICPFFTHPVSIGRNCDKNITSFLSRKHFLTLPIDEPNYGKQLDLLDELSDKATELEKIFRLDEQSLCDPTAAEAGARAVRRIKNLEMDREVGVATKEYYRDIIRFTDDVIRNYSARGLCKYPARVVDPVPPSTVPKVQIKNRPDLVCGPNAASRSKPTCFQANDDQYVQVLKRRLLPSAIIPEGQPCILGLGQLVELSRLRSWLQRIDYPSVIATLETHFAEGIQFCDAKAGLECQSPGKDIYEVRKGTCGVSEEMKKKNEMKQKKNSGNLCVDVSRFFIHVSFFVTLFSTFN